MQFQVGAIANQGGSASIGDFNGEFHHGGNLGDNSPVAGAVLAHLHLDRRLPDAEAGAGVGGIQRCGGRTLLGKTQE